jgi:hypothetical protein
MSLFGLGSDKQKSWIADEDKQRQLDALTSFNASAPTSYTPTSSSLIELFRNPFTQQVTQATLNDLEMQRQRAVNSTGDAAMSAHAYGGSRHGVAESLTNEAFGRIGASTLADLNARGFETALGAARDENARTYQYPLTRQNVLNQTVNGITPLSVGKTQSPTQAMSNFGGLVQTAGNIASFFA